MFGLTKKDQTPVQTGPANEFAEWLNLSSEYDHLADFLDDNGNYQAQDTRLGNAPEQLVDAYAEFLHVDIKRTDPNDEMMLKWIHRLPHRVALSKSESKKDGVNWRASYNGGRYVYGSSIMGTLLALIDSSDNAKEAFVKAGLIPRKINVQYASCEHQVKATKK